MDEILSEEYRVSIRTDRKTGRLISEAWHLSNAPNELHRVGGPAKRDWDSATGNLTTEEYWLHGKEHRLDGPSTICYDPNTSEVTAEVWCQNGRSHREGGKPAMWLQRAGKDFMEHEEYWENGVRHRMDGPAVIRRHGTDDIYPEVVFYYQYGWEIDAPSPPLDNLDHSV